LVLVVIITIRRFVPTYIPIHWNYGTFLRQERPNYPPTHRDNTSDVYKSLKWGTVRAPDPYRWLENDDNCRQDWVSNQEAFTARHFSAFQDQRQLNETVAKAHDYTTVRARAVGVVAKLTACSNSSARLGTAQETDGTGPRGFPAKSRLYCTDPPTTSSPNRPTTPRVSVICTLMLVWPSPPIFQTKL
jgi:hypothetical protein